MKYQLSVFLLFVLSQASQAKPSCFQGWTSDKKQTYPTGYCEVNREHTAAVTTRIEIDFPTQAIFIHGEVTNHQANSTSPFKFDFTRCEDSPIGTVVEGVNPRTGEKYWLRYFETGELPATGHCLKTIGGIAELSVDIDGQIYLAKLECRRCVWP